MLKAVYPGSFDPITHGHIDIITRGRELFDEFIVAVSANPESLREIDPAMTPAKEPLFSLEERMSLVEQSVKSLPNVEVDSFSGLLVNYVSERGAKVIIRGLRRITDFEYEFQLALMNRVQNPDIETLFMVTSAEYHFVSSSLIKEVFHLGGDISNLVPAHVVDALERIYPRPSSDEAKRKSIHQSESSKGKR